MRAHAIGPRKPGRPRAFNTNVVLDRALKVFWQKGYEGTSLSDLTSAMKISRPSLYAAFGDKQALFHKVLDHYDQGPAARLVEALREPKVRIAVERLLMGAADQLSCPGSPRGCLHVRGALACGDAGEPIRKELGLRRDALRAALQRRFRRAKAEGDLSPDSNPTDLARYVTTVLNGMSVQAAGGATRKQLHAVARTAMLAWPT